MKILLVALLLLGFLVTSKADNLEALITKDWKFENCLGVEGRQGKVFQDQGEMIQLLEKTGIDNFKKLEFIQGKLTSNTEVLSFAISYKPVEGFQSAHHLQLLAFVAEWEHDYDTYPKPLPKESENAIRFNMKRMVKGKTQYLRISCLKDASKILFQFIAPK